MTERTEGIYNAVPGSPRVLCGRDDILRVSSRSNSESSGRAERATGNSEDCSGKEDKNIAKKGNIESSSVGKSDDWTNSKVREIEDTLGTLGSLIDEYKANNNNETTDKEAEHGYNAMEVEQERTAKRKKEHPSMDDEKNVIKTDNEDDVRPSKRGIAKSKMDMSLPIYSTDSSSEKEESPGVECTGIEVTSGRGRKTKSIKTPRRKTTGSLEISIKEMSQTSDYGKYEDMTAPRMGSIAIEWLNNIEIIRRKCGNIQGKLSGHIKDRVLGIKEIIKSLIRKAESKGDPSVLRARNIELTADLKVLKGENESRKKETEMLKRTIEDLKKEVAEL